MSTLIPGIKKSFRGEGSTMQLSGKSSQSGYFFLPVSMCMSLGLFLNFRTFWWTDSSLREKGT